MKAAVTNLFIPVLSGAAESGRAAQAMKAVRRELVLPQSRVALLFKPPFDKTLLEPGCIEGYPAGIRENGGQLSELRKAYGDIY